MRILGSCPAAQSWNGYAILNLGYEMYHDHGLDVLSVRIHWSVRFSDKGQQQLVDIPVKLDVLWINYIYCKGSQYMNNWIQ